MAVTIRGRMSTFSGPDDRGVRPDEGLSLVESGDIRNFPGIFLPKQPPGTTGLARRLDPEAFYVACRWSEHGLSRGHLTNIEVTVSNPATNASEKARPVDTGPDVSTGRVADLSPGLARALGLKTDDECVVTI